jgi:hypothetical protein
LKTGGEIKKSGHPTKSNCDEENQHYTQTAVDLKSQWEELNTNQSTRSCSHTVLQFGAEERKTRTAAEKFLGEKGTDPNRRSAGRTKTKIGSTCPDRQI